MTSPDRMRSGATGGQIAEENRSPIKLVKVLDISAGSARLGCMFMTDDERDEFNATFDDRRERYGDPCPACKTLRYGGDCPQCYTEDEDESPRDMETLDRLDAEAWERWA